MKTLKEVKNFVQDLNNDLQGFGRALIVQNLQTIEREINKKDRLLEMVIEDIEELDGEISITVINKIKKNLADR
jgi:archaellum component FlaC